MKNPTPGMGTGRTGGRDLLRGHDLGYIYRGLWRFLSHYKLLLIAAVLLTALSSILSISGTGLAGSAIGAIAGESDRTVWYYLLRMVIFYVLSALIGVALLVIIFKLVAQTAHAAPAEKCAVTDAPGGRA